MGKGKIVVAAIFLVVGAYWVWADNCGFRLGEYIKREEDAIRAAFQEVLKSHYSNKISYTSLDELRSARADCCHASRSGFSIFATWDVRIDIPGIEGSRIGAHYYDVKLGRCGKATELRHGT